MPCRVRTQHLIPILVACSLLHCGCGGRTRGFDPDNPPDNCGDGFRDDWEQCDGQAMPQTQCLQLGLEGGELTCRTDCTYDLSRCLGCGNHACEVGESHATCPTDCSATIFSAGRWHTCVVHENGGVDCWGANFDGQLGNGTTRDSNDPVNVHGVSNAVAVSAGKDHTCALLSDGTGRCWGSNSHGELGNGESSWDPHWTTPTTVSGLSNAVAIAAGSDHTCAVISDGTARCWGINAFGRVGDGTESVATVPKTVSGLSDVIAISSGEYHACAVLSDRSAWCWGGNIAGELGIGRSGTGEYELLPVRVEGLSDVITISAGFCQTCAVLSDGTIRCWGTNDEGQLGDGTTTESPLPVPVVDLANAVAVSTASMHTCASLSTGEARCWGNNTTGQLGNGTFGWNTGSAVPVAVSLLSHVILVSTYGHHSCAMQSDRTVWCWGENNGGFLGLGTTTGPNDCWGNPCAIEPTMVLGL